MIFITRVERTPAATIFMSWSNPPGPLIEQGN
jgi:hypothetical protein